MRTTAIGCLLLAGVVFGGVTTIDAQQAPRVIAEPRLSRELTARLFGDHGDWVWTPAIDNRPGPLVASERRILLGTWTEDSGSGFVAASVYVVGTLADAEKWLALHAKAPKDWTAEPYSIGDGGWWAKHRTGQIEIVLRCGVYVITVSGKDVKVVEQCARQIALYFSAT